MRSGIWAPWTRTPVPHGFGSSWCREIREGYGNGCYAVLVRPLASGVVHLAIRSVSNLEPPWRDLQRIKNELVGPERFAVQVQPPASRLVDDADMYHLWVMPDGYSPGFGLHDMDEARS